MKKRTRRCKLIQCRKCFKTRTTKIYCSPECRKIWNEENKRLLKLGLRGLEKSKLIKENLLGSYIREIFPDFQVIQSARYLFKPWHIELDFYIPILRLGFEYNGEQHYKESVFNFFTRNKGDFKQMQYRDRCKKRLCKLYDINLIIIKYDEELSKELIISRINRLLVNPRTPLFI